MSELPVELVTEILARVSIKGLFRFRCVCKSWRSLFQDESLIRKHTTHAPTMDLLLINSPSPRCGPPIICTYEGRRLEKMIYKEAELNNGGDKKTFLKTIVNGHGDGLFCLQFVDGSLAVWNPILRELRKVSGINQQQTKSLIGFGYDHSIQDHKIVLTEPWSISKAQVLTLKSSVPRLIDVPLENDGDWFCWKREGILVGENIFWQLYSTKHHIEVSKDILTFNVVSETFNYCFGPSPEREVLYRNLNVLRGSLCEVQGKIRHDFRDMVVLCADHEKEDKGRIKSWSKILSLKASDIERSTCWKVSEFQLGTMLNQAGSLLVQVRTREGETKLCEYNLEEGTVSKIEATFPINLYYYGQLYEFIATLVPARVYKCIC